MASDKKMIFVSHQRNKGKTGDYCSHFSVTFQITELFFKIDIGKKMLTELRGHDGKLTSDIKLI